MPCAALGTLRLRSGARRAQWNGIENLLLHFCWTELRLVAVLSTPTERRCDLRMTHCGQRRRFASSETVEVGWLPHMTVLPLHLNLTAVCQPEPKLAGFAAFPEVLVVEKGCRQQ